MDCSLRWAAKEIKEGRISQWVVANCYLFVKTLVKVPRMAEIVPNTTPHVGAVAIFEYSVKHVAYVESIEETGFWVREANYIPAKVARRFIKWDDIRLRGFYSPQTL